MDEDQTPETEVKEEAPIEAQDQAPETKTIAAVITPFGLVYETRERPSKEEILSGDDIAAKEEFVRAYNIAMNAREQELDEREKWVNETHAKTLAQVPILDEKQSLVASLIAKNEDILREIEKREGGIQARIDNANKLLDLHEEKNNDLIAKAKEVGDREKAVAAREAATFQRERDLNDKDKALSEKEKELSIKQTDLESLSENLALERQELEATQKQIQKMINLSKKEKEANA